MTVDYLSAMYVHSTTLQRYAGDTAYGDQYDTAEVLRCFVSDGLKTVVGPNGAVITSSTQVAYPAGTPFIPIGSMVTVPAVFGGRTSTVVQVSVADGGGLPTPDHVVVWLQ